MPWEQRDGGGKTLKEVVADLRKDIDLSEKVFNGDVTGFAHGANDLADRITKNLTTIGKGLEHAGKIPELDESFLQHVHKFKSGVAQYGKDMAQRVPRDAWAEPQHRGYVVNAEDKMAKLGDAININITAIEKGLSGSKVVTPELKHAAGLSLLRRGELPNGIHRELGDGDPKAVSGLIQAFIEEERDRKIPGITAATGITAGTISQKYAVIDDGEKSGFYKVAVQKVHASAQIGDFMGGMRKPGKPELSSSSLTPQQDLKSNEVQR
ncbi:hypothetical protein HAP94_08285 [Acidithiobacillus ferrivorans]|nr:hypothetical protein [Acidithiobacillus ferrivorans]